mgnify:CR=1 FL=1
MRKPWKKQQIGTKGDLWDIVDSNSEIITTTCGVNLANEIIHCVNTHQQLVGALEATINELEYFTDHLLLDPDTTKLIIKAKAALAAAKEGIGRKALEVAYTAHHNVDTEKFVIHCECIACSTIRKALAEIAALDVKE